MPISGGGGRGSILTEYTYNALLAAGASFIPTAQTIIFTAQLFNGDQDLDIVNPAGNIIRSGTDMGATEEGYIGGTYFAGNMAYMNTNVAQLSLILAGLTIV